MKGREYPASSSALGVSCPIATVEVRAVTRSLFTYAPFRITVLTGDEPMMRSGFWQLGTKMSPCIPGGAQMILAFTTDSAECGMGARSNLGGPVAAHGTGASERRTET